MLVPAFLCSVASNQIVQTIAKDLLMSLIIKFKTNCTINKIEGKTKKQNMKQDIFVSMRQILHFLG